MLEYQGKYGKAKVMLDSIEAKTVAQIYEFLNHEAFTNHMAIMPDAHVGNGAVIGFTMPMTDKVIPNVVGVDINCALHAINVGDSIILSRPEVDELVRKAIPFGTSVHTDSSNFDPDFWEYLNHSYRSFVMKYNKRYGTNYDLMKFDSLWLHKKCQDIGIDQARFVQSMGTLGGGNHFIELGESEKTGDRWFTVHSGSRQFGLKICNYWQKKAGKGPLAFLTGDDMFGYLTDMVAAQAYGKFNRFIMINLILKACGLTWNDVKESIQTNHNFIDFNDFIIRKGAIRSYKGERMMIPFNMEDGILICEGKSNPEWNYSAPHGAGRVDSRRWAKENLNLDEARRNMEQKNIYFSTLPIDETKGAYKDPQIIEDAIEPTATIIDRLKPLISMKDK